MVRGILEASIAGTFLMLKRSSLFGLLLLLAAVSGVEASSLTIDNIYRFIRTDTYAETGGIVDNGLFTTSSVSGIATIPGSWTRTLQNEAYASSASGSADSVAFATADSNLVIGPSSVYFEMQSALQTDVATTGDGVIAGTPYSNSTRSFSFWHFLIDFTITEDYRFDVSGTSNIGPSDYIWMVDQSTGIIATGLNSGILNAGTYRFSSWAKAEFSGSANGSGSRDQDLLFTLNPVPIPAAIWLFGTGILGLIGFNKRRKIS